MAASASGDASSRAEAGAAAQAARTAARRATRRTAFTVPATRAAVKRGRLGFPAGLCFDAGEVLIGRDVELAAIEALLDRRRGLQGLVLVGEPGVGKTRLWLAGVEAALARDARVLATRPTGADAEFGFAALADLLDGVVDELLPALPAPQRRALGVALAREDAGPRGPDDRAVAAAVLGALRLLARDTQVVVAADDLQWLDAASARVLEFALRRLTEEDVVVIATLRTHEQPAVDLGAVARRPADADRARWAERGGASTSSSRHGWDAGCRARCSSACTRPRAGTRSSRSSSSAPSVTVTHCRPAPRCPFPPT